MSLRRLLRPLTLVSATGLWILGATLALAGSADPNDTTPPADSALQIQELQDKIAQDPSDAEAYTQLGILYMKEELFDEARAAFISALQAAPAEPGSHLNLGVALLQMERYEEAQLPFSTYLSMVPNEARGYVLLGKAQAGNGQLEEARATWLRGVDSAEAIPAQERLLLLQEIQNSYLEAEEPKTEDLLELARILEAHDSLLVGDDAKSLRETIDYAYQQAAKEARDEGRNADALSAYAHLRERGSTNRAAWTEALEILLDSQDLDAATALVEEARLGLSSDDAVVDYLAGRVASQSGDLQQAATEFRRVIDKDPEFPGVYAALGETLAALGDHQGASRVLAQAVRRGEGGAAAAYNMGVVLNQAKKYSQAIDHLKEAIKLDPDRRDAYRALGLAYRKTKQYAKSAETYQALVDRFGADPNDLYQLAYAQAKNGDHRRAVGNYSVVTALQTDNRLAHYNLGNSLLVLGRYQEAAASFQRALELEPDFHSACYNLALCYQKMEDYDKAVQQYELALEMRETYASLVNLAICYKAMGDEESSNEYYRLANELKKNGPSPR